MLYSSSYSRDFFAPALIGSHDKHKTRSLLNKCFFRSFLSVLGIYFLIFFVREVDSHLHFSLFFSLFTVAVLLGKIKTKKENTLSADRIAESKIESQRQTE